VVIDAYVHVGLPRFQTVESAISVMDGAGIEKALVCPFETCPDLETVHSALDIAPGRFVAAGIPIGGDRAEIEAGVSAQFAAGLAGLRLAGEHVRDQPWILDLIGRAHGFALVCGSSGLVDNAIHLLDYLNEYGDGLVIGGHFAGPRDPAVFDENEAVRELFGHERFLAVFSRQGLFPEPLITEWAAALIERVGWERLVWASEAPVLHWRDESIETAMAWVDRFSPSVAQREAFFGATAQSRIFERPVAPVAPLGLPFDPFDYLVSKSTPMWNFGLNLDSELPARLVAGWVAWGGSARGPLRHYLEDVLRTSLPALGS